MTDTLRQKILILLSRDINRLYSISEISKQLGSAYSHSNKFVNELAAENIIKLIKVANANICTLNLKEPLTISYLSVIEYQKLQKSKIKDKKQIAELNLFISRIKGKISIESIFINRSTIYILVQELTKHLIDTINSNLGSGFIVIDRNKFKENQEQFIKDHLIVYGAERFWENITKEIKLE